MGRLKNLTRTITNLAPLGLRLDKYIPDRLTYFLPPPAVLEHQAPIRPIGQPRHQLLHQGQWKSIGRRIFRR